MPDSSLLVLPHSMGRPVHFRRQRSQAAWRSSDAGAPLVLSELGLTDFLGGWKLESEHPTGGHYAKRTEDLHQGIQTGSRPFSAQEWEIAGANCPRPWDC